MKLNIDEYNIGDEVDVFANSDDIFTEFSGKIVNIKPWLNIITVRDQDDDCVDVDVNQVRLTYSEEDDDDTILA